MSARKGKPVYAYMFDAVNIPTESYGVCVRNKNVATLHHNS